MLVKLSDDVFGTHAVENQVKMTENPKADREGHPADAFTDELSHAIFCITFMYWEKTHVLLVMKLLKVVFERYKVEAYP